MKRLITILPLLSLLVISCHREPVAEATVDLNPAYVGELIHFTSYSTNTNYVEWDMDDGTMYSSPIVDHFYMDPGYYDVQLRAFGDKGGVSTAVIPMQVIGSEVTIVVEDVDVEGLLIAEAEVYLFRTLEDWDSADLDRAIGPFYTNSYGEVTIDGLSYQRYYVDVFYRYGDEGWVNWDLGAADVGWIETQLLTGWELHTFIAYVEAVIFLDGKKSAEMEESRKGRIPRSPAAGQLKSSEDRPQKENKTSVPRENR